jgi:hypothetical protein
MPTNSTKEKVIASCFINQSQLIRKDTPKNSKTGFAGLLLSVIQLRSIIQLSYQSCKNCCEENCIEKTSNQQV